MHIKFKCKNMYKKTQYLSYTYIMHYNISEIKFLFKFYSFRIHKNLIFHKYSYFVHIIFIIQQYHTLSYVILNN